MSANQGEVVALCGGVGGAKLAVGLQHLLGRRLTVVANVADDFSHLGFHISPDLDTVVYTLAGLNDQERGWGRAGESWTFMEELARVGGETWFALGDRDLAVHVERTRRLALGQRLTEITGDIARRLGVVAEVLPATDDRLRTMVATPDGELEFQRYFVERRCEPVVKAIDFAGAGSARMTPEVAARLRSAALRLIVICPSNPYLSVDPILAVRGMREALRAAGVPIVVVSPIIAGQAVKGPTRKIMDELRIQPTNQSIARHYRGLVDGLVVDVGDAAAATDIDCAVHPAPTLMTDLTAKTRLAEEVLSFGGRLSARASTGEASALPGAD